MKGWSWYGTQDLQVCPYMKGVPVYRDGMLPFLYQKTKEEGKLSTTFCGDLFNQDQFISFFLKLGTMQVLCEVEADKNLKPVGYSWLSNAHGVDGARSAAIGFCFFNGASKRSSARDLGRLGLAYMMEDLRIDTIHGILLKSNLPGRNYALRLGFREVAVVPDYHYYESDGVGGLVGARVMYLRKQEFWPGFQSWFESRKP
jgi:RimJ/RimL family protein N-acetyltransferase